MDGSRENSNVFDIKSAGAKFCVVLYSTPGHLGPHIQKADLAMRVATKLRRVLAKPVTYTSAAELIETHTLGTSRQQMRNRCNAACAEQVEKQLIEEMSVSHQHRRKVIAAMLGPELIRELAERGEDTSHIILIELRTTRPDRIKMYKDHPDYRNLSDFQIEAMLQKQRDHQRTVAEKYHKTAHGRRPHPQVILPVNPDDSRESVSERIAYVVSKHLQMESVPKEMTTA